MKTAHSLTEGSITKSLLYFSTPMILGNLLQQLYNVADTLIVGKVIGAQALSAVGSAYSLMVLLTSVILGLCMGSSVVFSRLFAAGKSSELRQSIFNAAIFILLFSVVINLISFFMTDSFVRLLNVPTDAVEFAGKYIRIVFAGFSFVTVYNFFACALRSIGNTKAPLMFLGIAAVTNIVLDILFVAVFNWSVEGAAIATVAAQALSALLIALYFFKYARPLIPRKEDCRFDRTLLKSIISSSVLTAIQQSIMNFGILMVQSLVNSFGTAESAAFAIVVKIDAFAYMPAQDFGNAFATFTAQNHGAGNFKRIQSGAVTAAKISLCFCAVSSAVVNIFAAPLITMFLKESNPDIIAIGVQYLRIEGSLYIGIGILFLLYGFYRGISKAGISVVLTVVSLGSRVALAYLLSAIPDVGVLGVWWAVPIGWALADILGIVWYFVKRNKLLKE